MQPRDQGIMSGMRGKERVAYINALVTGKNVKNFSPGV